MKIEKKNNPTRIELIRMIEEIEKSIECWKDDEYIYARIKENLRNIRNILYI